MMDESPLFLAPGPLDAALLFEASRILGRHLSVAEALEPFLGLLEREGGLGAGEAVLAGSLVPGARPDELVVAAAPAASGRRGRRVALGEGLAGRAIASERAQAEGAALAQPLFLSGLAVGALVFERPG